MTNLLLSLRCTLVLAGWFAAASATVSMAQTTAADAPAPAPSARPDRAIQRIHTEDASNRIDEVRVGGETQSITVQPKAGISLPAYEVKPADSAKGAAPSKSGSETNGARVWNVLKF